ncbi:DUF4235 domain-containing protein [Nocardia xishanensis]|uniref:DUF4235 domain-containing protein n=1 Tax=Nocardia xishanensis TaxID=238964 RepID=A0ABW7X657_9NOCA|nr:DUF4235 domain-containing protein [Nocardia xishanensis]
MTMLYKPLGMIVGVLGGVAANAVFTRVWRRVSGEDRAPSATAREYGWREVLIAAALQGAIFGLVKAAVDRAGAAGYQRLTGTWPGR